MPLNMNTVGTGSGIGGGSGTGDYLIEPIMSANNKIEVESNTFKSFNITEDIMLYSKLKRTGDTASVANSYCPTHVIGNTKYMVGYSKYADSGYIFILNGEPGSETMTNTEYTSNDDRVILVHNYFYTFNNTANGTINITKIDPSTNTKTVVDRLSVTDSYMDSGRVHGINVRVLNYNATMAIIQVYGDRKAQDKYTIIKFNENGEYLPKSEQLYDYDVRLARGYYNDREKPYFYVGKTEFFINDQMWVVSVPEVGMCLYKFSSPLITVENYNGTTRHTMMRLDKLTVTRVKILRAYTENKYGYYTDGGFWNSTSHTSYGSWVYIEYFTGNNVNYSYPSAMYQFILDPSSTDAKYSWTKIPFNINYPDDRCAMLLYDDDIEFIHFYVDNTSIPTKLTFYIESNRANSCKYVINANSLIEHNDANSRSIYTFYGIKGDTIYSDTSIIDVSYGGGVPISVNKSSYTLTSSDNVTVRTNVYGRSISEIPALIIRTKEGLLYNLNISTTDGKTYATLLKNMKINGRTTGEYGKQDITSYISNGRALIELP